MRKRWSLSHSKLVSPKTYIKPSSKQRQKPKNENIYIIIITSISTYYDNLNNNISKSIDFSVLFSKNTYINSIIKEKKWKINSYDTQ